MINYGDHLSFIKDGDNCIIIISHNPNLNPNRAQEFTVNNITFEYYLSKINNPFIDNNLIIYKTLEDNLIFVIRKKNVRIEFSEIDFSKLFAYLSDNIELNLKNMGLFNEK